MKTKQPNILFMLADVEARLPESNPDFHPWQNPPPLPIPMHV
jgi:hypothetical protein